MHRPLEMQQQHHGAADRHGRHDMPDDEIDADGVHQQHRHFSRHPRVGVAAQARDVGHHEHRRQRERTRRNQPGPERRNGRPRDSAEQGDQRKRPHAGDARRRALALHPDQQPQHQSKSQPEQSGFKVHVASTGRLFERSIHAAGVMTHHARRIKQTRRRKMDTLSPTLSS